MEGTMTERKDDRDDSNEDERTIFNLKKVFGKIGKIECIRLRSCIPVNPKLPQRLVIIKKAESTHVNAYIRFVKKESVDKALELNGTQMQEHHLFVDRCIKRRQYDKKRAVFLGNLAFDIGEEEIYTHFTDCGEIDRIRVVRDPHNYIGKGFGFESYSVGLALKLNDSLLKNRKIRVTRVGKKSDEHKMKAKVVQRRNSSMNKVQQKKATATFKKRKPAKVKQFSRKLKKQVSKKPARSFMNGNVRLFVLHWWLIWWFVHSYKVNQPEYAYALSQCRDVRPTSVSIYH
ncbi:RNA-binding protein 34 [Trichinella nativa]|uniref:RNA-binding protein 34 n=1 Tax=Trichinella nativa TaxID=6335 RepID=A0A0V1KW64_9BILA|nr:RNA-binding protein 34 [Trichinella nativa]